jgi:hypothetical protein
MKEIRAFAAVLQALESSSKASCRLCTAEVRGSTPLGSTPKSCRLHTAEVAGSIPASPTHGLRPLWPSPCTPRSYAHAFSLYGALFPGSLPVELLERPY